MSILREYFEFAYIHCVHYLVNKKLHWTEKIFWFICILLCTVCAYFFINETIDDYNGQRVSIIVDTSYLHWKVAFPSIVFCEKTNSKIRNVHRWFNKTEKDTTTLVNQIQDVAFYRGWYTATGPEEVPNITYINTNFSYFMNDLRSDCEEIFTSCTYNTVSFDCCEEFLPIESYYGKCYAINNLASRDSKAPKFFITRGPNKGVGVLSVELRHQNMIVMGLSPDAVPARSNLMNVLLDSESRLLSRGYVYRVFLNVKEVVLAQSAEFLDISKRTCRMLSENDLETSPIYSFAACNNDCLMRAQKEFCNCIAHVLPGVGPEDECSRLGLLCLNQKFANILEKTQECKCISSCSESTVYVVGTTEKRFKKFRHKDTVQQFYFIVPAPTMRYLRIAVKTFIDLIVAVGGTLGLFLGISTLSFVQLFYYILMRPATNTWRGATQMKLQAKLQLVDKNLEKLRQRKHRRFEKNQHERVYVVQSYRFQATPFVKAQPPPPPYLERPYFVE